MPYGKELTFCGNNALKTNYNAYFSAGRLTVRTDYITFLLFFCSTITLDSKTKVNLYWLAQIKILSCLLSIVSSASPQALKSRGLWLCETRTKNTLHVQK